VAMAVDQESDWARMALGVDSAVLAATRLLSSSRRELIFWVIMSPREPSLEIIWSAYRLDKLASRAVSLSDINSLVINWLVVTEVVWISWAISWSEVMLSEVRLVTPILTELRLSIWAKGEISSSASSFSDLRFLTTALSTIMLVAEMRPALILAEAISLN